MELNDGDREVLGKLGINETLRRHFEHRFNMPAHWVHIISVYPDELKDGPTRLPYTAIEAQVMNGQLRSETFIVPDTTIHGPLDSVEQVETVRNMARRS